MQRISVPQRPGLMRTALAHGFEVDRSGGVLFWDETAYYRFTLHQIEEDIEGCAEDIHDMCVEVLNHAIEDDSIFRSLNIPEPFWDIIAQSWRNNEQDLMGRLDLSYDGEGPAKLLEYNGDTPTTLYESSIFQWEWLVQAIDLQLVKSECDQFNLLHEYLLKTLEKLGLDCSLHLACMADIEDDRGTVEYIEDCAKEVGLDTYFLNMKDIGIDSNGRFTDLDDQIIRTLYKLYPWEWMMDEGFGCHLLSSSVHFIEPPWKAVLSNKGLLPVLWQMFEGHPNLLPAYFEDDPRASSLSGTYVRKPLLSRRGLNIEIISQGKTIARNMGPYGNEGYIVQDFQPLPCFGEKFTLVGCWVIGGHPAGLCLREDKNWITSESANLVPHVILD
jgi:glutathionylspermidine synthase